MKLILQNGYPYPLPKDFDSDNYDSHELEIENVVHFQWLHTLTVEFADIDSYRIAVEKTNWIYWGHCVLEAGTSVEDGYHHPAIIVKDKAYCGFILVP